MYHFMCISMHTCNFVNACIGYQLLSILLFLSVDNIWLELIANPLGNSQDKSSSCEKKEEPFVSPNAVSNNPSRLFRNDISF